MILAWLSKASVLLAIAAAMTLAAALLGWLAISSAERILSDARAAVRAERDAHWRAEIAASSIAALAEKARQAQRVAEIEAAANARVREVEQQLQSLENANAALPDGDTGGIGRDRVRLLPR